MPNYECYKNLFGIEVKLWLNPLQALVPYSVGAAIFTH